MYMVPTSVPGACTPPQIRRYLFTGVASVGKVRRGLVGYGKGEDAYI